MGATRGLLGKPGMASRRGSGRDRSARNRAGVAAVLILPVALGCEPQGPSADSSPYQTRDSAGVRIVENARPPDDSRLGWTIGPDPVVSIGELDGEDPYLLHWARDATRLADGRIAVANGGTQEIRVFDAGGRWLDTWGRSGEGPTDFEALRRVEVWPGDSIAAWASAGGSIAVYDDQGNFGRTFALWSEEAGWLAPRPEFVLGDGRVVSWRGIERRDSIVVELWSGQGRLARSLGAHPGEEPWDTRGERGETLTGRLAYGRDLVRGLWGDLIVASPTSSYEIRAYRSDGALERIVRRGHLLREPTEEDRPAYVEESMVHILASRDGLASRGAPADMIDEYMDEARRYFGRVPFARYFPAFASVMEDAAAYLWVEEYELPREQRPGSIWTVFDPEGRVAGFVETPDGLTVREVGEDYILGWTVDELGVERVELWPLGRGAG